MKMMCLKALPHLHRPCSMRPLPHKSLPPRLFSPPSHTLLPRASLSATMAPVTTVEHVVLFKTRGSADRSQVDAMISNLRSLTRLGIATYLTAGPVRSARSADSAGFTHLLHSRYRSESELASYSAHPDHLAVVRDHVFPACDDVMAIDWLSQLSGSEPAHPQPGSALRLTLAKLKPGSPPDDVIQVLSGMEGKIPGMTQLSYGENISPARAKGYSLGFISVFSSAEDLEALEGVGDVLEKEKEKVRPMLESVIVLDFVVPAMAPAASL